MRSSVLMGAAYTSTVADTPPSKRHCAAAAARVPCDGGALALAPVSLP